MRIFTETQDHTLEQCKSPIVNNLLLMSDSQPITQFQLSQQIIQPSLSNYQLTQSQILAMPNMQSANTISSNMFTQSQFFVTNSQPTLTSNIFAQSQPLVTPNMQPLNAISKIPDIPLPLHLHGKTNDELATKSSNDETLCVTKACELSVDLAGKSSNDETPHRSQKDDKNNTLTLLYSYITNIAFSSHNVKTKRFKSTTPSIACEQCNGWIHSKCLNLQGRVFKLWGNIDAPFYCCDCYNISDALYKLKNESNIKTADNELRLLALYKKTPQRIRKLNDIISSNNDINEFNLVKDEEKDKDISSDYHIYDVFNGDDIISSNNDINEFNLVKDEENKDISSDNHIYDIFNGDDIISSNNDINEFNLVKDEEKDKDTSSDNHINDVFNGDDDIKLKISEYISNNKRIDDKNNLDVNIPENIILDEKLEGLHFKNFDSLTLVEMLINPSNIVQCIPRGIKNNVFFTVMKTKKKTMQTSYDDDCGAWTGKKTSSTKRYFVIEDTIKGPYLLMENKLYKKGLILSMTSILKKELLIGENPKMKFFLTINFFQNNRHKSLY
ncbi:unnamed protein product [Gordionus sp. m RMFG-2023]